MGCTCSRPKKSKATTSNVSSSQQIQEPAESNHLPSSDIKASNDSSLTSFIEFPSLPRQTEFCFQGPIRRQRFSFSDKILYYMAKNPTSARLYQKMIQSCKYFFVVHPVIVVSCLKNTKNGWRTCLINKDGHLYLDIDKIQQKLWLCGMLHCDKVCPALKAEESTAAVNYTLDVYISKFYRHESDGEVAFGKQTITFDQLLFFVSAKSLKLDGTIITHENGLSVQIETIIAKFPKLESIHFTVNPSSSNISTETVKELLKIPHFTQMKYFLLHNISDTFDIEAFYKHLKERNNFYCTLKFRRSISDEYFARLEMMVDELLETKSTSFRFPWLIIPNLDIDKQWELIKRCNRVS